MNIQIDIKTSENYKDLPLPYYATEGSAGMDLLAVIDDDILIKPGERQLIKTGIFISLPNNYEAQIRPRSGLALKNGITVLNAPGTIDSDYRGEICVIIINLGYNDFTIIRGMRIAQMVISPVSKASLNIIEELSNSDRNDSGFGSTGK